MVDLNLKINQIMSTPVISVEPDASILDVENLFNMHEIHHIPVVKDKKILGIISKSDYFQLQHHLTFFKRKSSIELNKAIMRSILAEEVMIKHVATLRPTDKLAIAASLFRENLFHAIPIVDDQRCLVGILTTYDMINYAFREPFLLSNP